MTEETPEGLPEEQPLGLPGDLQSSEPGPAPEGGVYIPPEPLRIPFWGFGDLFLVAALALPCMFAGVALVKLAMLLLHWHAPSVALEAAPEMLVGYGLLFGVMALIFHVQYDQPLWRSLGWTPARVGILWNILAGLGTALVVALAGGLMGHQPASGPLVEMMKAPGGLVPVAIFGTTVAPLCEELLFRGFLQPLLVRNMGAILGILITSALFGGLHYSEYAQSWRLAVQIGLSGVAFGYMRHVTGSTRASTIMHAAFNSLSFVSLFANGGKLPQ